MQCHNACGSFVELLCCNVFASNSALETESFSAIAGSRVSEGKLPYLRTESGKIEFSSEVAKNAGANAVPTWEEPQNAASKEMPHLLIGEQVHHTSSFTTASSKLMAVSKMYNLDAAWVNSCIAQEKGINEGDNIKLTTSQGSITVRAHVTGLISPSAVWVPAHYGATSDGISQACGFGAAVKQLVGTTTDKRHIHKRDACKPTAAQPHNPATNGIVVRVAPAKGHESNNYIPSKCNHKCI